MTPKERLMHTLFNNPGRTHRNIKLCRGTAETISVDDLYAEVAGSLSKAASGEIKPETSFGENYQKVNVNDL